MAEQSLYEFGPFCLDTRERVLLRDRKPVSLKPKVYETLLALVSSSGHIVDKEELMRRIWPEVEVEENNLTGNIFALRKVFAGHEFIETIPRRGYRFTADVKQVRIEDVRIRDATGGETEVVIKETISTDRKQIDSLAVLPFINAGADPEAEYLADGITESLISSLSQLPGLRVAARNTVFRFKDAEDDPQEIGGQLKVGAVLTGRVLQFAERLIIRAELASTADGWQLWGAQFDRRPADILALQAEIAHEISESLRLTLTGQDRRRLAKRPTESTQAYHAYLRGRYQWNKRTEEGLKKGIEHFQEAIDIDPVYALAYTGLADCYGMLGTFGGLEPLDAFPKAKIAAAKALEIDDTLAEAHTSWAFVNQIYERNWPQAELAYARAVELNPNYATAYHWRATLLAASGRPDEAIAEIQHAQELDPLSLPINTYVGWAYYFAGRYEEAIKHYRKTLEMDTNFIQIKWRLGLALAQAQRYDEAISCLREGLALFANSPLILGALGFAYGLAGKRADAERILDDLETLSGDRYVSAYHRAAIYAGLGETDQVLNWLEQAHAERSGLLIYLNVEPIFDSVRNDPRFEDLLRRVRLLRNYEP